jgi:hypothetical protein
MLGSTGKDVTPMVTRRHFGSGAGIAALALGAGLAAGCTPTVKLQAPDKPIEINLNVKIDQEVRVRLDRDVEDMIAKNPGVF